MAGTDRLPFPRPTESDLAEIRRLSQPSAPFPHRDLCERAATFKGRIDAAIKEHVKHSPYGGRGK